MRIVCQARVVWAKGRMRIVCQAHALHVCVIVYDLPPLVWQAQTCLQGMHDSPPLIWQRFIWLDELHMCVMVLPPPISATAASQQGR